MKRSSQGAVAALLLVLATQTANAATAQLQNLPLSVETNDKMLTLTPIAIEKIYPAQSRPEAVFLTGDKKVTMGFEWRQTLLKPTEVSGLVGQFPAVIKAQVPGLKSLTPKLLTIQGTPWAQFIYTLSGKSGDLRREMLITSAQGRMLILNVDSSVKDYSTNDVMVRTFVNGVKVMPPQ
ncbi:hypothetical protein [Deinococcus sp.]|uniref:hypothetical protein n=1 Tax=Deinococcus sp. TaxID=47478 RepID=UPI003B5AAF43